MKKLIQRMLRGFLSLLTTFLIMASPVAAMVYASEPDMVVESFSIKEQMPSLAEKNAQADSVLMADSAKQQTSAIDDDKHVLTEQE